jgi:AraC-like DNA-binding protein
VAGSIGIISVCLVLALSNGFNNYILGMEEDMLSYYPITVSETTMDVNAIMMGMTDLSDMPDMKKIGDRVYVNSFLTNIAKGMTVTNNISDEYIDYLEGMDPELYEAIQYSYGEDLMSNLYTDASFNITMNNTTFKEEGTYSLSALKGTYTELLSQLDQGSETNYAQLSTLVTYLGSVVNKMPGTADFADERFSDYVLSQYELIDGAFPKNENEAILVVGENNDVTDITLVQLGLLDSEQFLVNLYKDKDEADKEVYLDYKAIREKEYYLCTNDEIYRRNDEQSKDDPYFFKYTSAYNVKVGETATTPREEKGEKITISGILRLREGLSYGCLKSGLNLTEKAVDTWIAKNMQSELSKWVNNEANAAFGISITDSMIDSMIDSSEETIASAVNMMTMCAEYLYANEIIKKDAGMLAERLKTYVAENLAGDLCTQSVCERFYISRSKLYRLFAENFGMGFSDYVCGQRMRAAKKLLRGGDAPVWAIAEAVGIKDANYFVRLFKSREGLTPLQYRKSAKK